tara:strand:+ start:598 stop:2595 length:1998 start_codon:yes stop_codon:yes gene_type:complete
MKPLIIALEADTRKLSRDLRRAEQNIQGFGGHVNRLSNTLTSMLGPAMIGAAAGAGYLAVQFGVDGVKAFMDDEAAAAKLATTFDNLGLAQDTAAAEATVDVLQRQFGVADDLLRPSLEKLVLVTGDVAQANKLLSVALDTSAGTGRSLEQVTQSISRAASGSATALSRIAPALDTNILKTGNLNAISAELSRTFGGQAQTAASTYKGQLDRLAVGFSELQESFGAGFLNALGKTESKTGDLMTAMEDLQPAIEDLGTAAGNFVIKVAGMVTASDKAAKAGKNFLEAPNWADLADLMTNAAEANSLFNKTIVQSAPFVGPYVDLLFELSGAYDVLAGSSNDAYGGVSRTAMALGKGTPEIDKNTAATMRWNAIAQANDATVKSNGGNLEEYFAKLDKTTSSTGSTTTATDLLSKAFELQSKLVAEGSEKLQNQTEKLKAANEAVANYASTLSGQLLGGIDLAAAQQTGTELGTGTMAAFDAQIAQANWFGNVLEEVKRQNGSQALIDYMAQAGPAAGGKFGQEAIDNGLVPEFSSKLDTVINSANILAQAMVPEGLRAGVDMAKAGIEGMAIEFGANSDKLVKMGKRIGKTVGDNATVEILKAVTDALDVAEKSRTAAAAREATRQASGNLMSDQQIAQQFVRIVQTSNSRTGYSMGVPVPSPVL